LHIVDAVPLGDHVDPVDEARKIAAELERFSPDLASRERWLVLNKMDLLPVDERAARQQDIVTKLGWEGPVFAVSALASEGTLPLCQRIWQHIESRRTDEHQEAASEAPPQDDVEDQYDFATWGARNGTLP
jgi:GTP-binding protein